MKPTVITVGDPAGIGPDCIIRACASQPDMFTHYIIVAPKNWLQERASLINSNIAISEYGSLEEAAADSDHPGELQCWNPLSAQQSGPVVPGKPSSATAMAVIHCIQSAALACLQGRAAAMVTGPIEKAVLRRAGFDFPGHTEFLAHLAAEFETQKPTTQANPDKQSHDASDFVMMLASDHIRVALLTTHMALRDVPDSLNVQATLRCLHIVNHDLRIRFGIATPRLALCALNPHAGEQGHFGREEIDILAPAAQLARDQGIMVSNPLPADTAFSAPVRNNYDAMVCCYHDQALIPLKSLSFGEAVNVTLGLPFIRTSVDHGTALDRVGKASVSCTSLIAAMNMAERMSA